jgi:hypothetical protein
LFKEVPASTLPIIGRGEPFDVDASIDEIEDFSDEDTTEVHISTGTISLDDGNDIRKRLYEEQSTEPSKQPTAPTAPTAQPVARKRGRSQCDSLSMLHTLQADEKQVAKEDPKKGGLSLLSVKSTQTAQPAAKRTKGAQPSAGIYENTNNKKNNNNSRNPCERTFNAGVIGALDTSKCTKRSISDASTSSQSTDSTPFRPSKPGGAPGGPVKNAMNESCSTSLNDSITSFGDISVNVGDGPNVHFADGIRKTDSIIEKIAAPFADLNVAANDSFDTLGGSGGDKEQAISSSSKTLHSDKAMPKNESSPAEMTEIDESHKAMDISNGSPKHIKSSVQYPEVIEILDTNHGEDMTRSVKSSTTKPFVSGSAATSASTSRPIGKNTKMAKGKGAKAKSVAKKAIPASKSRTSGNTRTAASLRGKAGHGSASSSDSNKHASSSSSQQVSLDTIWGKLPMKSSSSSAPSPPDVVILDRDTRCSDNHRESDAHAPSLLKGDAAISEPLHDSTNTVATGANSGMDVGAGKDMVNENKAGGIGAGAQGTTQGTAQETHAAKETGNAKKSAARSEKKVTTSKLRVSVKTLATALQPGRRKSIRK